MTQKFVLQGKPNKNTNQILVVWQIFHKQKFINFGTGVTVLLQDWNKEEQRVRKSNKQSVSLNGVLASYSRVFESAIRLLGTVQAELKRATPEQVRTAITSEILKAGLRKSKEKKNAKKTFIEYFEDYLKKDNDGKAKTSSTLRQYRATINIFEEYEEKEFKKKIMPEQMGKVFFEGLQAFLYAKAYETNSMVNFTKLIKTVLHWITSQNIPTDKTYLDFKPKKVSTTQIALSITEIEQIKAVQLPSNLTIARDLFLFQFYTSIRYSDLLNIHKDHFKDKKGILYLSMFNQKTSKKIEIPLPKNAIEIATKYNFEFAPVAYSLTLQNIYIRTIGEMAGINEPIEVMTYKQGKKEIEFMPKYKLLASHTARRSFITYATSKTKTASQIADITGQSINTVMRYIKNNDENKENTMKDLFE